MKRIFLSLFILLTLTTFHNPVCFAECPISYYVSPAGNDNNSCLFPGTPCETIKHAIEIAIGTETCPVTIHVAAGTYTEHIVMDSWESLEGGWNSDFTNRWDFEDDGLEPDPAYLTVIDGEDNGTCITQLEVSGANINGFTIQNGRGVAGGIYLDHSHPTVTNCTIKDNYGLWLEDGQEHAAGGMCNYYSSPTVVNCSFVENFAYFDFPPYWGAFAVFNEHSQAKFIKCIFTGKTCGGEHQHGNGMVNIYSSPIVSECRFEENGCGNYTRGPMVNINSSTLITSCSFLRNRVAENPGAAMYNRDSTVMIINSEFLGNYVADHIDGGVAISNSSSECTMINCTLADNRNLHWPMYFDGVVASYNYSHSVLWNCIVWGNIDINDAEPDVATPIGLYADQSSTLEVYHSDIDIDQDGFMGINGNISQDPMFINSGWDDNGTPENPSDDVWVGGDYHLQQGSPCIDAGTSQNAPDADIEGNTRPQGFGYDMGAYEFVYEPTIDDVFNFIDAHEDIIGAGSGQSADKKFIAFMKMLEKADDLIVAGKNEGSCGLLTAITQKCDGLQQPKDFITGDLETMESLMIGFSNIMNSLACE